jgi:hypothetical protein
MSKEREKRENAAKAKSSPARKVAIAMLILAAFAAVSYLGLRKRGSRFDSFAKCVAAKQARMYGAYWCPHCAEQKEMFESSFYVPKSRGRCLRRSWPAKMPESNISHLAVCRWRTREGTHLCKRRHTGCDLP